MCKCFLAYDFFGGEWTHGKKISTVFSYDFFPSCSIFKALFSNEGNDLEDALLKINF